MTKLNFKPDEIIKYSITHLDNGMYQAQREYGNKELYPAFDTLRDCIIFMEHITDDFKAGVIGNTQHIDELGNKI